METITDRLQAARADLIAYAAGETGTLRVGVYQSVGTRILPAIIGRFAQEWPRVEVRLTEAASDEGLLELVEPGQLDLTFGVLPMPAGPFEAVELLHDPFVLVTAAGSPLAGLSEPPSIALIAEQRLIGFRSCRSTRWLEVEHSSHPDRPGAAPDRADVAPRPLSVTCGALLRQYRPRGLRRARRGSRRTPAESRLTTDAANARGGVHGARWYTPPSPTTRSQKGGPCLKPPPVRSLSPSSVQPAPSAGR